MKDDAVRKADVHSIMGMARLGMISDSITIALYEYDGNKPHFHLFEGDDLLTAIWHTSICFAEAAYFHHVGEIDKLIDTEIATLISFLTKQQQWIPSITNWQYALALWNNNNPEHIITMDTPMPNYMSLINK